MKRIIKTTEPYSLVEHRANQPAFYENIPLATKDDLREALLTEQGYICCYCNKRIPEKIEKDGIIGYLMKVEHFKCQDDFPLLQLSYSNLFGACCGNEGKPKRLQTCDTRKGNLPLTFNLLSATPNCELILKYTSEGEISSATNDEDIDKQLNEVLNLNMQTLKDGRRQVYLEVQRKVESESRHIGNKRLKVKYFELERDRWLTKNEGRFRPFCMVAVYYLTKKIRQTSI